MQTFLDSMMGKRMMMLGMILLGVLSLYFITKTVHEYREADVVGLGVSQTNQLPVTGTADMYVAPDIALVSFTITHESKTVADAQTYVDTLTKQATDFLTKNGIADKDMKTTGGYTNPQYDYMACPVYSGVPCVQKQVIRGYEVSRSFDVKVRAIDTAGTIIQGLGNLGITQTSGPTLTLENEDTIRDQVRAKAIADARSKAESLASELGVRLVRVISFSEGNAPTPMYAQPVMMKAMDAGSEAGAPVLPKGENMYSSTVTVTYEIR